VRFVKLSPTKANTWLDCPRRFFFTYVDRRRVTSSWAHFSYGNAVHRALREWFEADAHDRTPALAERLVIESWSSDGFRDDDQSRQWRDCAVAMVAAYLAGIPSNLEPVATERTLAFKEEGFVVEGRIDRLDDDVRDPNSNAVIVIDYKTGKWVPREDDVRGSSALAMYAIMVSRVLGRPCTEVALHHIPSGEVITWKHTSESLARQVERMGAIATDIRRAEDTWESIEHDQAAFDEIFPPKPGPLCGFCDFWDACAAGQEHTARKMPWDGLGELDSDSVHR
jgi:hypothetical protein